MPAQGVAPVISPYDAQAVEAALRVKDATGGGKVTILSMGPASARDAVAGCLPPSARSGCDLARAQL